MSIQTLLSTFTTLECTTSSLQTAIGTGATIESAQWLPANSTFHVPPTNIAYPTSPENLPALCAVHVRVGKDEEAYSFGLFLPELWNCRFL